MLGLIGKKIGMTRLFNDAGEVVPVTVIQAGPCPVVQVKRKETDGYTALQIGFEEKNPKNVNKPDAARFAKAGVKPLKVVKEFRVDDVADYAAGAVVSVEVFTVGDTVDVSGNSKGRGHASPVKRHHTKGGPESHGQMYGRRPGSNGASSFPSRVWKGKGLGGHMGAERATAQGLKVVKIDAENNLIVVRGNIPGHINGYVTVSKCKKAAQQVANQLAHPKVMPIKVGVPKSEIAKGGKSSKAPAKKK